MAVGDESYETAKPRSDKPTILGFTFKFPSPQTFPLNRHKKNWINIQINNVNQIFLSPSKMTSGSFGYLNFHRSTWKDKWTWWRVEMPRMESKGMEEWNSFIHRLRNSFLKQGFKIPFEWRLGVYFICHSHWEKKFNSSTILFNCKRKIAKYLKCILPKITVSRFYVFSCIIFSNDRRNYVLSYVLRQC